MFKKEKTRGSTDRRRPPRRRTKTAYEDSWYRSLKAMAERPVATEDDERVERSRGLASPSRRPAPSNSSKNRLAVGPRCPWYLLRVARRPVGDLAGVERRKNEIWPIFIPG